MNLNNFLKSGFTFTPQESELKVKYKLFNTLLALNIFVVAFASLLRFMRGELQQGLFDISYIACAILIIVLARRYKNLFELLIKIILTLSLFIIALTYIAHTNIYMGVGWFFVQILISFFLSNKRFGFMMLFVSVLIIMGTEYAYAVKSDFHNFWSAFLGILPLISFTFFIMLFEKRNQNQQDLLKKQYQLLETYSFEVENYDLITRLPNRKLFLKRLEEKIKSSSESSEQFAAIKMDLDNFAQINNSYGHQFGDRVLLKVSKRLESILWEYEALSKIGPDEYMMMMEYRTLDEIVVLANRVLQEIAKPLILNEQKIFLSLSMGITIFPNDATDVTSVMKNVDAALYEAKHGGKNCFRLYDPKQSKEINEQVVLLTELKNAIEHREFEVYYQPQINAQNSEIIGMEALVRWNRADGTQVPPTIFIPLAEEHGLIKDIDFFVMHSAMKVFKQWKELYPRIGRLSLNLSMKLLEDGSYFYQLQRKMQELNFNPTWLKVEITESHIMKDPEHSINMLSNIHAQGIKIAIDDFGTGYSSLAYLQKLPIDKLKIDRSFILNLSDNKNGSKLVKSIINLSQSLDLDVIAEGVETQEEMEFLLKNGCSSIQGYLFSKPLSAFHMLKYIIKHV